MVRSLKSQKRRIVRLLLHEYYSAMTWMHGYPPHKQTEHLHTSHHRCGEVFDLTFLNFAVYETKPMINVLIIAQ